MQASQSKQRQTPTPDAPGVVQTKSIEIANEEFAKLSPAERRRAVARDVLAQLDAKKYEAAHHVYTNSKLSHDNQAVFRSLSASEGAACHVCGVGSVFVSTMVMANPETTLGQVRAADAVLGNRAGRDQIRDVFNREQLAAIETAFEGNYYGCSYGEMFDRHGVMKPIAYRACDFNKEVEGAEPRLRRIMENIVENGEFRP